MIFYAPCAKLDYKRTRYSSSLRNGTKTVLAINMLIQISTENVGMMFPDGTKAVQNVTFDVAPNEFVTVVGPSGCGKSTSGGMKMWVPAR